MLAPPCYVISDVHLGHASSDIERTLLAFLRALPGQAGYGAVREVCEHIFAARGLTFVP